MVDRVYFLFACLDFSIRHFAIHESTHKALHAFQTPPLSMTVQLVTSEARIAIVFARDDTLLIFLLALAFVVVANTNFVVLVAGSSLVVIRCASTFHHFLG
jgi:hypothetical protein